MSLTLAGVLQAQPSADRWLEMALLAAFWVIVVGTVALLVWQSRRVDPDQIDPMDEVNHDATEQRPRSVPSVTEDGSRPERPSPEVPAPTVRPPAWLAYAIDRPCDADVAEARAVLARVLDAAAAGDLRGCLSLCTETFAAQLIAAGLSHPGLLRALTDDPAPRRAGADSSLELHQVRIGSDGDLTAIAAYRLDGGEAICERVRFHRDPARGQWLLSGSEPLSSRDHCPPMSGQSAGSGSR